IQRWHYLRHVLRAFRTYRFPPIQLAHLTGAPHAGKHPNNRADMMSCHLAMAFNLPRYAMGLPFANEADGQDGCLHVVTFQHSGPWQAFRDLVRVSRHTHVHQDDVHHSRMRRLRMESPDGDRVPVQVDGDYAGRLPIEVEVLPQRVTLVSPRLPA
ncbi:MAG: hypothetical protein AAGD07_20045, partial [Planctomycetota bacterium]